MVKIFIHNKSKHWVQFPGTLAEAKQHVTNMFEEDDFLDCDNCWTSRVEIYDDSSDDITVMSAHYSGWGTDGKLYPVDIDECTKEEFKRIKPYAKWKWEHYLTQLDPRKDYIII